MAGKDAREFLAYPSWLAGLGTRGTLQTVKHLINWTYLSSILSITFAFDVSFLAQLYRTLYIPISFLFGIIFDYY